MTKNKERFENIAKKLVLLLKEHSIDAYIWCVANTGSVYIRFQDVRMCSIRIGDHDGKEKLKYKYNIRSDVKRIHWEKDETWRLYIPESNWKEIIPYLADRNKQIQSWPESKFKYGIPSFKKDTEPKMNIDNLNNQ